MATPSLSDFLLTYRQYKDDTDSIAAWLAQHALQCGYKIAPPEQPKSATTGRPKGKARKLARQAAAVEEQARPRYRIKVSDFVPMSKAIAEHRPQVEVPGALNTLFDRAIHGRKTFAQVYASGASLGPSGTTASNERHSHFIDILNAAWETLVPFQTARKGGVKAKPATEDKTVLSQVTNRFAHLHVEQPPDQQEPVSTKPVEPPDSTKISGIKVLVEEEDADIEEAFFAAIYAFFAEMNDIHDYLTRMWSNAPGIEASVVTNTAIHMIRRSEMALDAILERPKAFPASRVPIWIFPWLQLLHMEGGKGTPSNLAANIDQVRDVPNILGEVDHWKSHSFVFWNAWRIVKFAVKGYKQSRPDTKYTPEDKERLRVFEQAVMLAKWSANSPIAEDEISRGIRTAIETRTPRLWAVFGFRLLLDLQEIRGDQGIEEGFRDL